MATQKDLKDSTTKLKNSLDELEEISDSFFEQLILKNRSEKINIFKYRFGLKSILIMAYNFRTEN